MCKKCLEPDSCILIAFTIQYLSGLELAEYGECDNPFQAYLTFKYKFKFASYRYFGVGYGSCSINGIGFFSTNDSLSISINTDNMFEHRRCYYSLEGNKIKLGIKNH